MISEERSRRMDTARLRAELTVSDLWLRYVALGGTGDAFDLDGYLQGLVPLDAFQQDVLAQAVNEALDDRYRSYSVPLSTPPPGDAGAQQLDRLIEGLLEEEAPNPRAGSEPPHPAPE
jgi:hypothetical protein